MMGRWFFNILFIVMTLSSSVLYAEEAFRFDQSRVPYQLRESNQQLIQIHKKLKMHNTSLFGLDRMINDLNRIHKISKNCEVEISKGLDEIEVLSKQIQNMENKTDFESVYQGFSYDKSVKKSTLLYCQLLSYYSEKYLYEATQQLHVKPVVHIHDIPLVDILHTPNLLSYPIIFENFYIAAGLDFFSQTDIMNMKILSILGAFVGLLLGIKFRYHASKMIPQKFRRLQMDFIFISPAFFPLLFNFIFVFYKTYELLNPPVIRLSLLSVLFALTLLYLFVETLLVNINSKNKVWINHLIKLVVSIFLANFINLNGVIFLTYFVKNNILTDLIFKGFLMLINIIYLILFYQFFKVLFESNWYSKKQRKTMAKIQIFTKHFALFFFIFRGFLIINGQDTFAVMINIKFVFLILTMIFLILAYRICVKIYSFFEHGQNHYVQKFRNFLHQGGLHLQQKEFLYLRLMLMLYLMLVCLPYILSILAFSSNYLPKFQHIIYGGITIFNFNIVPIRLLNALIIMLIMMLISNWMARYSSSTLFAKYEIDRRHTFSMIIKYLGMLVSLILFVTILGISLEHLSMILGLFSFGVGIGMQSILIDLMAGLIVLMHKPIRINDYVSLSLENASVTGHIQKILLLSTQIITDDQSVMHVRNSNILKGNLENHSLFNQISKCFIPFSLSNVNDFEKAKAIILNIVRNKPEINQTGNYEPEVILDSTNAREYEAFVVINVSFYINQIETKQFVLDDVIKKIIQALTKEEISFSLVHHHD